MIVFDTGVISFTMRAAPPAPLMGRIAAIPHDDQAMTSITAGELVYGAQRSPNRERLLGRLDGE